MEAFDVLDVLNNTPSCSKALKERALQLAAKMLELGGKSLEGQGLKQATEILESGKAVNKFMRICEAQGGFHFPPRAKLQFDFVAGLSGTVVSIDNRTLARIAKLAGAPRSPASGIVFMLSLENVLLKEMYYIPSMLTQQENCLTLATMQRPLNQSFHWHENARIFISRKRIAGCQSPGGSGRRRRPACYPSFSGR